MEDKRTKKVEKVVTGGVTAEKKSGLRKVKDNMISADANSVKSYIVMDVLLPAAKKAVYDIVVNGINMFLYGEAASTNIKNSSSSGLSARIAYNECYNKPTGGMQSRRWYDFDSIQYDLPTDANFVIERMNEIVSAYGIVSVADLYDLSGLSCDWTAQNYGWTSVASAQVVPIPGTGKYTIKLPKALPIK